MIENRMRRKTSETHTRGARPRRLKVGDRVRFLFGTRDVVADVVEDRGDIGVGGRQLVAVLFAPYEGGERERTEVAAEEVTLEPKKRPTRADEAIAVLERIHAAVKVSGASALSDAEIDALISTTTAKRTPRRR